MNVKYPIATDANLSSEAALQELISKIRAEPTGHYLLSEGGRWHGGIHITEHSHRNHAFEPIRALADGELVAYRITEDYLQSTYQDQILQYSNSFCLLRHQCPIPESENTFTFYSLYMHLRPLKCQPGLLYRVKSTRSIRSTANPADTAANRKTLPAGSLIECLVDVPAEQHTLNNSEYLFIKARTYHPETGAAGERFWIALHEKNRPSFYTDGFEAQDTHPRWYPQPTITPPQDDDLARFRLTSGRNIRWASPPYTRTSADALLPTEAELLQLDDSEITAPLGQGATQYTFKRYRILTGEHKNREGWMAFEERHFSHITNAIPLPAVEEPPEIQRNQLVVLDTPIPLRAGDPLGYLGLHERLCREGDGSTEHSYQIHLETFAAEPPPHELFNTEHWCWMKVGEITDQQGNPEEDNTFFQDLLASLDENSDQHLSHGEVLSVYQNDGKATSLEHLISLHTSEWHDDANRTEYRWWEVYLGQVHAWARRHDERLAFYRRLQDNLAHEKERLTQLKWFDAAQDRLGLNKEVWHMHPIRLVSQMLKQTAWQEPFIRMIRIWEDKARDPDVSATISWFYTSDLSVHGYMLEREGPSTTTPNQKLRIPAGVYNLRRHRGSREIWMNVPILYNEQVPAGRGILIHVGNEPENSYGCLLPGRTWNPTSNPNYVGNSQVLVGAIMRFLTNTASSEDPNAYETADHSNPSNDLDAGRAQLILEEDFQDTTAEALQLVSRLRTQLIQSSN